MRALSRTRQYLLRDASFLHCSCREAASRWDFCSNGCCRSVFIRYAGLAMLMAAAVIRLFPSANDFVINVIEKSGH
jgi:hypothetical protein